MTKSIIKVEGLTKTFPPNIFALKDISFSVEEGAIYGLVGESGAGKSTLMRVLSLLEPPTAGKIWFEGEDLTALCAKKLRQARKKWGMVFQHFNLFSSRTALENVLFPLEIAQVELKQRRQRAEQLLELVGLQGKQQSYPAQLSGGEKQRVALARALAHQPSLLLCDEPTSALDPTSKKAISDLLLQLNQRLGLTILLITHQMEVIKEICSQMAVIDCGQIVERGRVVDLFTDPKAQKTKHLLQDIHHKLPENFFPKQGDRELLRLAFQGQAAGEPVISKMIKSFDIEVNILLGGIDRLQEGVIGNLVIELSGAVQEREKAKKYLKDRGVICVGA